MRLFCAVSGLRNVALPHLLRLHLKFPSVYNSLVALLFTLGVLLQCKNPFTQKDFQYCLPPPKIAALAIYVLTNEH